MKTRKKRQFFLFFAFFIPFLAVEAGFSASITLPEAIRMALANNKKILDAKTSLEIAQLNLQRAEKLLKTPQLNINLDPLQTRYDVEKETSESSAQLMMAATIKFPRGTDISFNYQGTYDYEKEGYNDSYSLEMYQSLFEDYSLTPSAIELYNTHIAREKARLALEEMKKEVILNTVKSFFQLQEIRDSLDLIEKRIVLSQEKLTEIIRKKASGLAGELDVLKVKIELAENTRQFNELKDQLVLAKDQFYHSLGAKKNSPFIFSPVEEEKLSQKAEELLVRKITQGILLSQNEIRQAQWTVDEKQLQLKKKKEDLSPDWSLTIGYVSGELVLGKIVPGQWQAKIGINYNLFDGGRAKLSVQMAEADLEKARRNLESLKKTIQFNLSSKRNALKEALSRLNLWKLKKDEIKLRARLSQEQFTRGILSSQEFREFQLQEIQLENNYQSALHNLLASYLSYRMSLNMKLDIDEVIGK